MAPSAGLIVLGWLGGVALSALLTRGMINYATRMGIQDVPNSRSSHQVPTARGGGVAIVAVAALAWLGLGLKGNLAPGPAAALLLGSLAIAAVGWWDDRASLSARIRLSVHFGAAALLIVALGPDFRIGVLPGVLLPPGVSWAFSLLYLVWMTNLYNFMDGIDGLAAGEAVTVASVLALVCAASGLGGLAAAYAALAASSLGFLTFNWSPARIFMGDVGSGFLGFAFGALSLMAERDVDRTRWSLPVLVSILLLGVFIVDSGVTLVRRAVRKCRLSEAHRDHAYQKVVRAGGRHSRVSGGVLALNLLWLTPCALCAWVFPSWGPAILSLGWLPLFLLAIRLRAGAQEP